LQALRSVPVPGKLTSATRPPWPWRRKSPRPECQPPAVVPGRPV